MKKYMKTSELIAIGYTKSGLYKAANSSYGKAVQVAFRACPNGAWIFDTEKLNKVFAVLGRGAS